MVGRVVDGRYRIQLQIARGGMATVYLAVDERLDRQVALKVMHDNLALDPEFVSRFVREARAAARLSHPNVVQVFDQGSDGPVLYLAMEYLPGRTLRDVLAGRGALTPRESVSVLEPVLGALAAAHRAGIVHGDVKPENVILTDDGRIKVADFGLARAITAPITVTAQGELLGTVAYLAPELVSHGVADARADVYAAGILLFELLTGRQPFTGPDPLRVAYRHVHENVPAPTSLAPAVPAVFDPVVLGATSHDPDQRPPDAGRLLADLRAAVAGLPPAQLDLRAADAATVQIDLTDTGSQAGATRPAPAAAPGPQPTQVLAVSRRQARSGSGGAPILPRLKINDDEDGAGPPGGRRRVLGLIAGLLAVVLVILVGVWWVVAGPGSYTDTPPLVGQRTSDAQRALLDAGLADQVKQAYSTKVPAGQVISTDPAAGERVKKSGTVVLTVSLGVQLFPVPDVTGMTLHDATAALHDAHLTLGTTSQEFSATVQQDRVISSSPKAKTTLARNKSVNLVLSKGGGGLIKGVQSGLCLDVPPDVTNNGTRAWLDDCNGGTNQQWALSPTGQLTLYGGTRCLDVSGAATDNGTAVQIWDCTGAPNQQWTVNPDGSITSAASGKCLDAVNQGTAPMTLIQIWDCSGGANQKWARN